MLGSGRCRAHLYSKEIKNQRPRARVSIQFEEKKLFFDKNKLLIITLGHSFTHTKKGMAESLYPFMFK